MLDPLPRVVEWPALLHIGSAAVCSRPLPPITLCGFAGMALKRNITTLGPMVLPYSEQLLFAANVLARKVYGNKRVRQYVPNFGKAFDHVCIHTGTWGLQPGEGGCDSRGATYPIWPSVGAACPLPWSGSRGAGAVQSGQVAARPASRCPFTPPGGRAVIDEIEKQLVLGRSVVEPSRASLFRFGNVSSSSIWCEAARCCAVQGCIQARCVFMPAYPAESQGHASRPLGMSLAATARLHVLTLPIAPHVTWQVRARVHRDVPRRAARRARVAARLWQRLQVQQCGLARQSQPPLAARSVARLRRQPHGEAALAACARCRCGAGNGQLVGSLPQL